MQWNGTKDDLIRSLRLIPAVLAGTHPDPSTLHSIFWGTVGNAVLKLIESDFKTKLAGGQGLDGESWAKLAVATLKRKRPVSPYTKTDILAETGALLASLRPGVDERRSGVPDQVFEIGTAGVTVGTSEEKADWHQKERDNMPARPIVPEDGEIPQGWETPIEAAMQVGLERAIEEMCRVGGIV